MLAWRKRRKTPPLCSTTQGTNARDNSKRYLSSLFQFFFSSSSSSFKKVRLLFGVSLLSLSSLSLFRRGELTLVWRAESEKAKTNEEEKKKKKNEMTLKKSDREEERLSCLSVPLVSRLQSLVSPQTIEQTIVADSVTFLLRYFLSPQAPPTEREAHNNNKNKNKKKKKQRIEKREKQRLPLRPRHDCTGGR